MKKGHNLNCVFCCCWKLGIHPTSRCHQSCFSSRLVPFAFWQSLGLSGPKHATPTPTGSGDLKSNLKNRNEKCRTTFSTRSRKFVDLTIPVHAGQDPNGNEKYHPLLFYLFRSWFTRDPTWSQPPFNPTPVRILYLWTIGTVRKSLGIRCVMFLAHQASRFDVCEKGKREQTSFGDC